MKPETLAIVSTATAYQARAGVARMSEEAEGMSRTLESWSGSGRIPVGGVNLYRMATPLSHAVVPVPTFADEAAWTAHVAALTASGALHPEEAAWAATQSAGRRGTFVAGRLALRQAMRAHGVPEGEQQVPIGRSERGAPLLPTRIAGSLSHKATQAMAVVATREAPLLHVGVDLERRPTAHDMARPSIARRILTDAETEALAPMAGDALQHREFVHLHFAIKEAVYKAIDPLVQRYVGFREVEVLAFAGGAAEVRLHLPELQDAPLRIETQWTIEHEWIRTTAVSRSTDQAFAWGATA